MSLERDIFPEDDPSIRSEQWIQTEWAEGWGAQFHGLGLLTELIAKHFHELDPFKDQAGLAAVFLQRHRIEISIKAVLAALDSPTTGHDLMTLWARCKDELTRSPDIEGRALWDEHLERQTELVQLIAAVDQSSFVFRYPTDIRGARNKRPRYIDFDALERACKAFGESVEMVFEQARQILGHLDNEELSPYSEAEARSIFN